MGLCLDAAATVFPGGVIRVARGASQPLLGDDAGMGTLSWGHSLQERNGCGTVMASLSRSSQLPVLCLWESGGAGADASTCGRTCRICLLIHAQQYPPPWPCSSVCPSWQPVCGAGSAGYARWK